MKYFAPVLFVVATLVSGCSTYTPSSLPHTYVTNTQQHYTATGIRFQTAPFLNDPVYDGLQQALLMTKSELVLFVNGQVVARGNSIRPIETVAQLPPGTHVVAVQNVERGLFTLGFEVQGSVTEYSVTIPSGSFVVAEIQWEQSGQSTYRFTPDKPTTNTYFRPVLNFTGATNVQRLR